LNKVEVQISLFLSMKNYHFTILAVYILSINLSLSAQEKVPDFSYTIVASKNGINKTYQPGARLFLKYETGS